jgi:hypothetical protein
MFFIKEGSQYWTGKEWADDYHQGIVYGSAAAAISNFPRGRKKECLAVALNSEQWAEHASSFSEA